MPERDWQRDWKRLNTYLEEEELNPDFPHFAANALSYWLFRVRELEEENAKLRRVLEAAGITLNDAMIIERHLSEMEGGAKWKK